MAEYSAQHWDVVGHDWAVDQLTLAMNSGRSRHAYLFSGPPAIGKRTLARAMAMALNCQAETGKPCGTCRPCKLISQDKHPDITFVEADRVGGTIKIDQIRNLQHTLALRPYEARYRVAIIKRYQEAHAAASNALLKTLEEPAQNVVIILLTDNLHAILPTILSRCQHLPLHPLPLQTTAHALQEHWQVPDTDAKLLAHLSGGRLGWAVQTLQDDSLLNERYDYIDVLEQVLREPFSIRFGVLDDITRQRDALAHVLQLWQTYWRDAFLLAYGSHSWVTNIDRYDNLQALVEHTSPEAITIALEATRRTLKYIDYNVNAKLAIETMMLDYPALPKAT